MASEQRLGASFSIDTTDLKAGLAQANRLIKESESEFKAAAAKMDDWRKSADGLTARNTHLSNTIDLQKKKIAALKEEYNKLIAEGMNPASKEAVEYRTKINNETTALKKNEKELDNNKIALKELSDESKDTSKATDKLNDSTKKTGKSLSALKGTCAIAAAAIAAIAAAAIAGIKSLLNLAESTRELRTEMGRLETGFETAGLKAEDATNTYNTLYGVLGDTGKASEAASHLALLANNSEDLAKWTDIATGVYATFGDSLPIEGLTEAANETAKVGDLTGVLADALNWAGVNEDDFQKKLDACTNEQERQKLITETLNGLYSESAKKYKEVNKEVIAANEAANNLAQAQADLGAAVEPLNTIFTNFKTTLLTEFSPAITSIIDNIIDMVNGVEGSSQKLATSIGDMVGDMLQKLNDALPEVSSFALDLVMTIVTTIIEQLPQIVQTGIEIITTLVSTLGDSLPTLIPTIINAVLLIVETLINNIDKIIDAGVKLILGLADGLVKALPQLVSKIPIIIQKLLRAILDNLPKLLDAGVQLILSLANGLMDAIPDLLAQLPTIINEMVKGLIFEGIPALIKAGGDLLAGLFQGMLNPSVIWENIKKIGSSIWEGFKDFFGIHSPSKLFRDEIGSYLGQGMALGVGDGFEDKINGVNKNIVKTMQQNSFNAGGDLNNGSIGSNGNQSGVVINQYNTYSKAHSRYELFKSKQETAAAVRLAIGGGVK